MHPNLRRSYLLAFILSVAGCHAARVAPTCDPTPTGPHSALAWGPARLNDTADARGRVVDARTGMPLSDAFIMIEPGRRTFRTDSLGEFRLRGLTGGVYRFDVRHIGYYGARDSVRFGIDGLRLLAALAPGNGIVDYVCTRPAR